jgi:hypothetical protein
MGLHVRWLSLHRLQTTTHKIETASRTEIRIIFVHHGRARPTQPQRMAEISFQAECRERMWNDTLNFQGTNTSVAGKTAIWHLEQHSRGVHCSAQLCHRVTYQLQHFWVLNHRTLGRHLNRHTVSASLDETAEFKAVPCSLDWLACEL